MFVWYGPSIEKSSIFENSNSYLQKRICTNEMAMRGIGECICLLFSSTWLVNQMALNDIFNNHKLCSRQRYCSRLRSPTHCWCEIKFTM